MCPNLEEFTTDYLKQSGPTTGTKLYEVLKVTFPSLTGIEFADLIWRLADHGQVELYDEPEHIDSFLQYLREWERNVWYHASVAISLLALVVTNVVPSYSSLAFLRWGFGLMFVLFIPGYVTVEMLLPADPPGGLERYALSVGASLVLDMLIGLFLNYTSWGIDVVTITVSLATFSICSASVALVRKFAPSPTSRVYPLRD